MQQFAGGDWRCGPLDRLEACEDGPTIAAEVRICQFDPPEVVQFPRDRAHIRDQRILPATMILPAQRPADHAPSIQVVVNNRIHGRTVEPAEVADSSHFPDRTAVDSASDVLDRIRLDVGLYEFVRRVGRAHVHTYSIGRLGMALSISHMRRMVSTVTTACRNSGHHRLASRVEHGSNMPPGKAEVKPGAGAQGLEFEERLPPRTYRSSMVSPLCLAIRASLTGQGSDAMLPTAA